MKKIVVDLLFFFTPLVLIFIVLGLTSTLIMNNWGEKEILDNTLETKILNFYNPKISKQIIIAGDSRAERQVIPLIFENEFNIESINIATSSCDLVTALAAIRKYNMDSPDRIFIISTSLFQVNDGTIYPGSLSKKTFQQINLLDKLKLYGSNSSELMRLSREILISIIFSKNKLIDGTYVKNDSDGFLGIEGNLDISSIDKDWDMETIKHPWYNSLKINGIRWRLFKNVLNELNSMNAKFLIYQPPISPAWRESTKNTFIDDLEKEYSQKLNREISKYDNIKFIDFYNNETKFLNNTHYYDPQHLNNSGAIIFTKILSNNLRKIY